MNTAHEVVCDQGGVAFTSKQGADIMADARRNYGACVQEPSQFQTIFHIASPVAQPGGCREQMSAFHPKQTLAGGGADKVWEPRPTGPPRRLLVLNRNFLRARGYGYGYG